MDVILKLNSFSIYVVWNIGRHFHSYYLRKKHILKSYLRLKFSSIGFNYQIFFYCSLSLTLVHVFYLFPLHLPVFYVHLCTINVFSAILYFRDFYLNAKLKYFLFQSLSTTPPTTTLSGNWSVFFVIIIFIWDCLTGT